MSGLLVFNAREQITSAKLNNNFDLIGEAINVVTAYGAVGDGATDNTIALSVALAAAVIGNRALYFPPGVYLTGVQSYRGVSLIGDGPSVSILLGTPSKDILALSSSDPVFFRQRWIIQGLGFRVNNSVDASATFTTRNGVGNVAISASYNDANAALPLSWHNVAFRDVAFTSTSGSRANKTGCFWSQRIVYNTSFDRVSFQQNDYGFIIEKPANLASTNTFGGTYDAFSNDHNSFKDCDFLCTTNFQHINGQRVSISNLQIYSGDYGFLVKSIPNNNQDVAYWTADNVFVEDTRVRNITIEGNHHVFNNLVLSPNSSAAGHENIRIDCSYSHFTNGAMYPYAAYAGSKKVQVYGKNNIFSNVAMQPDAFDDQGRNNRAHLIDYTNPSRPSGEQIYTLNKLNAAHINGGLGSVGAVKLNQPRNVDDLYISPSDMLDSMNGPGTYSVVKDATLEFGERFVTNDYFFFTYIGGRQLKFGDFCPMGRVRLWAKVRKATAGTATKKLFIANATTSTNYDENDVTYTNAWTLVSNDVNCSSASAGDVCQITFFAETGVETQVAWILIQPIPDEAPMGNLFVPTLSSTPSADSRGGLRVWWDGANLKAIKPDASTVTIF